VGKPFSKWPKFLSLEPQNYMSLSLVVTHTKLSDKVLSPLPVGGADFECESQNVKNKGKVLKSSLGVH
jgi:hypothetical protein